MIGSSQIARPSTATVYIPSATGLVAGDGSGRPPLHVKCAPWPGVGANQEAAPNRVHSIRHATWRHTSPPQQCFISFQVTRCRSSCSTAQHSTAQAAHNNTAGVLTSFIVLLCALSGSCQKLRGSDIESSLRQKAQCRTYKRSSSARRTGVRVVRGVMVTCALEYHCPCC